MMNLFKILSLFTLVIVLGIVSNACSAGNVPVSPGNLGDSYPLAQLPLEDGHFGTVGILGAYELTIDPSGCAPTLTPKRHVSIGESYLVEGMGFFIFSPCTDCFKLAGLSLHGRDLTLIFSVRHPFDPGDPYIPPQPVNRLDLDVFDLAVVIDPQNANATHFDLMHLDIYNESVLEPDGYTTELDGFLSNSAALPYFLVVDDSESVDPHTWNEFAEGDETTVDVTFRLDLGTPLSFDLYLTMGYGWSAKRADRFVPKYYNPEFNKKPAWKVEILPTGPWFDLNPIPTSVFVEVYDWQTGATVYGDDDFENAPPDNVWAGSEVHSVSVEIPGMTIDIVTVDTPVEGTGMPTDPLVYEIPVINTAMAPPGLYTGCVKVLDERVPLTPADERDYLIHKTLTDDSLLDYEIPEYATYQTFIAEVVHEGISLSQYDYTIGPSPDDPTDIDDSSHGKVEIGFLGAADPMYFNLSVDGEWRIQNLPLPSLYGEGVPCCISTQFNLGVPDGVDVTEVFAGWSLDTEPALIMPPPIDFVLVGDVNCTMYAGFPGFPDLMPFFNPCIIVLPPWVDIAIRPGPYFNQQSNPDECVPTAVSNSLKYLNKKDGKPPNGKPTDIKTMKTAVGQTGTYAGADWGNTKKDYMDNNGYDVDTSTIPATGGSYSHDATAADCDAAMDALKQGKDVEMNGRYHCAQVVAMIKNWDGSYSITVMHDDDQDDPKSKTVTETVRYDPSGNPPYVDDSNMLFTPHALNSFVVEGPK